MPEFPKRETAKLAILGAETAEQTVPVEVLVRALQGLQQTALILAAVEQAPVVPRRFKPSEKLRRACELRCGPVLGGSIAVELTLPKGSSISENDPADAKLLNRVFSFIEAVAKNDDVALKSLVPDSRFRARALRETLSYLPKGGQRWTLELSDGRGTPIELNASARRNIEGWFTASSEALMVVTGQLVKIDFDQNKIDIRYPLTKKLIGFDYDVDAEDWLIQNRRGWVQAKGRFELDDLGNPTDVIEVMQFEPVDFSPLDFDRIELNGRVITIDPVLTLEPALDEESHQFLVVESVDLNLNAYAQTRDDLVDEIISQLFFLWDEYARESPAKLTVAARKLQETLKSRMRE